MRRTDLGFRAGTKVGFRSGIRAAIVVAIASLTFAPGVLASNAAVAATATASTVTAVTPAPTEEPPPTLAGGRSLAECISAAPKPGCVTRSTTDGHQVIVFAILMLGMAFIFWRIVRSVRRRDARPRS